MSKVIEVSDLGKQYRLGVVGSSTISDDLKRFAAKLRGKEDPFLKVGELNDRTAKADSNYVWALQGVAFDVFEGDVLGIVGKNGAGKSTLLKLLSRITQPSTGHFKMKGRAGSLLEVGTGFHPELTGRENIFLNGAILGMNKPEIRRKLDEIIAFSGIERYIDTPVKRYSSGMMVRLGFAVAAHLEPEILIVDEVLAVGDVEFQKKCIGKMKEVSKHGRTILFVSHNMGAVRSLCTRGILLENGCMTYSGSADDVVDKYLASASSSSKTKLEWTGVNRPGNSFARLNSIMINQGESSSIKLFNDLEFRVDFDLEEKASGRLDMGLEIRNDKGDIVFNLGSGQKPAVVEKPELGRYTYVFKTGNRLNEGIYHVTLRLNENRGARAKTKLEDIISFEIIGNVGEEAYRRIPGVIRPEFSCDVIKPEL